MINFYDVTKENIKKIKEHPNWLYVLDHPWRILVIGGHQSRKANLLFNLISHQPDIVKICWYGKDPYEAKYQFLINKRESTSLKHLNDSKAFIEYSNDMDDIDKNIEECNLNKNRKILIVFHAMIYDMLSNKQFNPIVTELLIKGKTLIISFLVLPDLTWLC